MRILLVTPSLQQQSVLEHYFHAAGHEIVATEGNCHAALRTARFAQPDLVVLSGELPDAFDGVALAAGLQVDTPDPIPVMLVADLTNLPPLLRPLYQLPRAGYHIGRA